MAGVVAFIDVGPNVHCIFVSALTLYLTKLDYDALFRSNCGVLWLERLAKLLTFSGVFFGKILFTNKAFDDYEFTYDKHFCLSNFICTFKWWFGDLLSMQNYT